MKDKDKKVRTPANSKKATEADKAAKKASSKKFFRDRDGPRGPTDSETQILRIRAKLQEIKEYKRLIAQDGLSPDEDDKIRESALIVQLLRLEKGLPSKAKPKKTKRKPKRG